MKIIKAIKMDKYSNVERYTQCEGFVYKDMTGGTAPVFCVTLCAELEDAETTQYPLEDVLDQYYVNLTEVMEEKEEDGKHVFVFEVEGENEENIKKIAGLAGRRVFNYEEDGYIKLGIE